MNRWRVAGWLDHSRRFCWADLVSWALRSRRLREALEGDRCATESRSHRDRSCYCGKFRDGCMRVAEPLSVPPEQRTQQ